MGNKEIDKILNDLLSYSHPEFFEADYKNKIIFSKDFEKDSVDKYFRIISSIKWFLNKISRYEVYFLEFYPLSKNIKNREALEHHIHAYLEDVETLKNKLTNYIGCLKNDLKRIAKNKEEVSKALKFVNDQIFKVFKGVSTHRGTHRHGNDRFVDTNVINMEMAETMLLETNPIRGQLTQYAIDSFEKQRDESFEKGKIFWIETSTRNFPQIEGATNEILEKTEDFLYQYLNITTLNFGKKDNN